MSFLCFCASAAVKICKANKICVNLCNLWQTFFCRRQNQTSPKTKKHRINKCLFCASVAIFFAEGKFYCVNDIRTCKPALVLTMGALDEI